MSWRSVLDRVSNIKKMFLIMNVAFRGIVGGLHAGTALASYRIA
jgi:hypothetical protein